MNERNPVRDYAYRIADVFLYSGAAIAMYHALQSPMNKPTTTEFLSAIMPAGIGLLVYTCGEISDLFRLAKSSKLSNLESIE